MVRFHTIGFVVLIAGSVFTWLAFSEQDVSYESPVDVAAYQDMMANEVQDFDDLDFLVREDRLFYELITPPASDLSLRQPIYRIIPFSRDRFPKIILDILGDYFTYEYSVPVYKLRAVEDRKTRQLHFYSHDNERLFSIDAPADYDPFHLLKSRYPDLYSGRHSVSDVKEFENAYDPARVELIITLIPTEHVESYLYAKAQVHAYQMSLVDESDGDGFMMMGMGTESNIVIKSILNDTNGISLEIGYPEDFTNRLEVYFSSDLMTHNWERLSDPLATTGSASVVWVDMQAATFGEIVGFYAAGNHDLDSDGDGLSDAFEWLLGSDPDSTDTSGDGMDDGTAVDLGFHPTVSNETVQVWFDVPLNGWRFP
jgi:hypothetical protein